MEYERKSFDKLPEAERKEHLSHMERLGYTIEDIVELELDSQERHWRKSLYDPTYTLASIEPTVEEDTDESSESEAEQQESYPSDHRRR